MVLSNHVIFNSGISVCLLMPVGAIEVCLCVVWLNRCVVVDKLYTIECINKAWHFESAVKLNHFVWVTV